MERYPRLSRAELIERLRAHAAHNGCVTTASLQEHDPIARRSIQLHFVGIAAARVAAGVAGAPYKKPTRKTGPKPTSAIGRRPNLWTKQRVLDDLRSIHRAGRRTTLADLMTGGFRGLVHAATVYVGGLAAARALAGITPPKRRTSKKWWNAKRVVAAIRKRRRAGKNLSSSVAPTKLVTAGRWHFKSWRRALEAAGIDPKTTKLPGMKYTKAEIIKRLRKAAAAGSDLKSISLAKLMKMESVRREFGSLHNAIIAAGLGAHLERRTHGRQFWNRDRVIEVLRERAQRREYTLTPGLHRVVQLYFGGADQARRAAGVPSPIDLRIARRRRKLAADPPSRRRGRSIVRGLRIARHRDRSARDNKGTRNGAAVCGRRRAHRASCCGRSCS